MAGYGTIQRQSATTSSTSGTTMAQPEEQTGSTHKHRSEFWLLNYFNLPLSPENAAVRVTRNLSYYRLYYTLFVWIILFISLVPQRRQSLIFMVAMSVVTSLYLMLLEAIPESVIAYKIIDRRLVLALLLIVTVVGLILTRAIIHLLVSLAIGVPIILVHAVLRVKGDLFVGEMASASGELLPLVHNQSPV